MWSNRMAAWSWKEQPKGWTSYSATSPPVRRPPRTLEAGAPRPNRFCDIFRLWSDSAMQIGFLGGTGVEGKGLALRFVSAGAEVAIGSRSEQRAKEVALHYTEIIGKSDITGML